MTAYRPDIDGLRAISVLLVLFFHANLFGIQAGFIGVDIFFVISGYLITSGIKNGLEKNTFSFTEFFNRRLWRLQPVFIALIVVTILMTTLFYLPEDYLNYTKSAKWAARFQANKYFSELETGYFADDTSIMPLLHTWSLSIEWQWYLVLPFLMTFFYKIARIKKFTYWIIPLTLVAIMIPLYLTENKDSAGHYYSFSNRIFEMLIGSVLSTLNYKHTDKIPTLIKTLIGTVSLSYIVYTAFNPSTINHYPNWSAVGICLSGAALIYLGGGEKTNPITQLLSIKPLAYLGILSYSLYIWHWSVFAFIRNLAIEETILVTTIALATSFILAWLSYRFVESKFRKKYTIPFWKSVLILVILPYGVVAGLDQLNQTKNGFPDRLGEDRVEIDNLLLQSHQRAQRLCNAGTCILGNESSDNKALLIGDSYAGHSKGFFDVLGRDADIRIDMKIASACFIADGESMSLALDRVLFDKMEAECSSVHKEVIELLKKDKYQYVIIVQAWDRYVYYRSYLNYQTDEGLKASKFTKKFPKENPREAFSRFVNQLSDLGTTVVITKTTYDISEESNLTQSLARNVFNCSKRMRFARTGNSDCSFMPLNDDIWFDSLYQENLGKHKKIILIDQKALQCRKGGCLSLVGKNIPMYLDVRGHLTDYASYYFGKEYLEKYGNPFKKPKAQ